MARPFPSQTTRERVKASAPPPPIRNPKEHGFFSNLWSGIESIPGGIKDQEEEFRKAISSDLRTQSGIVGAASYPWELYLGTAAKLGEKLDPKGRTGGKVTKVKLGKIAAAPKRKTRSALDVMAEPFIKEGYKATKTATGGYGAKKTKEFWHDNPVAAIGAASILVAPAARFAGIGRMAGDISRANRVPLADGTTRPMTAAEATKLATVESYYPGSLDAMGLKGSPFGPRLSGRAVSRNPIGRAGQKAFDWASVKLDESGRTGVPLSATRRAAAGARRADDLGRSRLVTNAMRYVSTFADYLNDGYGERIGTAFGRRKEALASRDAAVGAALHASSTVDPVEAVKLAAEDTKTILQSGVRDAHHGDIGDLAPAQRVGQTVFITQGLEDGVPLRTKGEVIDATDEKVTVRTQDGEEKTVKNAWAHLTHEGEENKIPLSPDEIQMLERRYDHLTAAHAELLAEPRLQEKFRAATQSMSHLGQMNEDLGITYFTRGLDPTGSEALAIEERLSARRNQFLERLGGEGPAAIDYEAGLWGDLQRAMAESGQFTDEQQFVFLSVLDRQARLWANEVEGRHPSEYLESPEGMNLGGIDFSNPADLEANVNRMFQTAGHRHNLLKRTSSVLIHADPQVNDLVSTPKGMGTVHAFADSEGGRMVWVTMHEGANLREAFPEDQIRVSQFPWIGHPQYGDYVMTPDGPGVIEATWEGPAPDFTPGYQVQMIEFDRDMAIPTGERDFVAGEVQRINDPRDEGAVFVLASQKALGQPDFPVKATREQYRKALEKSGVRSDEFYWMGLSRRPLMEDAVQGAESEMAALKKKLAEDRAHAHTYGADELAAAQRKIDVAKESLRLYDAEPDESFLLDADYGGKSFPVQVVIDAVESRSHFLDLTETLYSSEAHDWNFHDKWGPNRGDGDTQGGLIIRDPDSDEPYHELVISLPDSDLYPAGHFPRHGNTSPLIHIRFHEIVDEEGRRSLLIDEMQSDWNNVGRSSGWRSMLAPHDERAMRRLRDKERRLLDMKGKLLNDLGEHGVTEQGLKSWHERLMRDATTELNAEINERNAERGRKASAGEEVDQTTPEAHLYTYSELDIPKIQERVNRNHEGDPVYAEMMRVRERLNTLNERMRKYRTAADQIQGGGGGAANRGPLVMGDASKYLAMKRLVRWAADHGQTRIIWVRGHEQGVRYSKFDELPIERRSERNDPDPSDYGEEFSYPTGSEIIDAGGYYARDFLTPEQVHELQQTPPIQVAEEAIDYDHYGDEWVLIPAEALPPDPSGTVTTGGHFERHGKIVNDMGDGNIVVQPVDPLWDPARFTFDYRGNMGGDSWGSWDVSIVNRIGETIWNDQMDGSMSTLEDVLQKIATAWEGNLRNWAPDTAEADIPKMHDLLKIIADSPWYKSEFKYTMDNLDYEFDEWAWNEYVNNLEPDDEEGGTAHGDFREIRDHLPSRTRRVMALRDDIQGLRDLQARDRERGVETKDYADLIATTERELQDAIKRVPNKGHSTGYDVMLPKVATALLKPYRKEADHVPVALKEEIYRGRYSSEHHGIISDHGRMHGWAMDLPEKMIRDAKDSQTLFQREGRKINAEEIATVKALRDVGDLRDSSRQARKGSDFGRAQAYEELARIYGEDNPYEALTATLNDLRESRADTPNGRAHPNANYSRVLEAEMRRMNHALGAEYPSFQRGNDIIKGASTWVGGPDGQRFIALTEHADFSTLMHEFIGHATEEMSRRYPELWAAVERDMKKPLSEWKVADHEKFAKQVERYWMEGKAPSPELHTMMKMIKEWMKGVYASITQLGKPMPESTRALLDRHLGQGITARAGARTYVPHVSQFDTMMDTAPGGTRLAAGGNVIGRPQVDNRNFGARRNRGILWQSGELALSARPIIDQYFRRTKYLETEAVRRELYADAHPLPKTGRPPKNAWMIRDPDAPVERLTARNKSKLSEDDFSRLIGEGDTPEEFVTKLEEIRKGHYAAPGEHPEWANDLENTRWVEGPKIEARIQNVFPSAPRGRAASSVGAVNTLARMAGIYLRPLHYLVGNIPQNVMMVALTNPSALLNSAKYGAYSFLPRVIREMAVGPRDLFAHDRHLYNRIKTETGDIQAGAGLPDFYTMANNNFQRSERRLNKISQGTAEKLGELADQPYRVSVWIAHAKKYGYNTPEEWRTLLDSERGTPEARIRDEIAQRTREDMIDFNTISPGERQNVSRFFYLWAFTRGFAKWPVTFAREYPGRTGLALMAADPNRTDDNGIPLGALPSSGILKSNQGKGKVRDLGFLDPTAGLRQQIETGISAAHGNFQGIGGMTTPPLETALQAITGGPRAPKGGLGGISDQLARDIVPGYDTARKTFSPGLGVRARVWRFLDADRFSVKDELGKGKNYEKKRGEDETIKKVLTKAERLDVLPQVEQSQDAYWHHKYLEQQIRFGAQARRKGTKLTDQEKLVILYATAAQYYPQIDLPPIEEILKGDPALQEKYRSDLRDGMFGPRNEVLG